MSSDKDKFNLTIAESQETVDETNKEFYGKFTFPWPPLNFPLVTDSQCGTVFLNQELGDWTHKRVPRAPKVWVAGCGTNQAVFTALRFPEGEVLGTDISTQSLAICERSASQLGIKNLRLEEKSLNSVTYREEFDYIISTGVIHHNADPSVPLARIAEALKHDGIIEIMVYNYFHRILSTAYQKAMRHLFQGDEAVSLDTQISATRSLLEKFPLKNSMSEFLKEQKDQPEAALADTLLQPCEYSYTVESLGQLLAGADLEFWLPCLNNVDQTTGRLSWNIELPSDLMAQHYDALPDVERWYITNLLAVEKSPMLWFYAQKKDSSFKRKSENELCQDFLSTRFEKYSTTVNNYFGGDGAYRLVPTPMAYPAPRVPRDEMARHIWQAVDPEKTMGEVIQSLDIKRDFRVVNRIRLLLTTPLFPYLKAA